MDLKLIGLSLWFSIGQWLSMHSLPQSLNELPLFHFERREEDQSCPPREMIRTEMKNKLLVSSSWTSENRAIQTHTVRMTREREGSRRKGRTGSRGKRKERGRGQGKGRMEEGDRNGLTPTYALYVWSLFIILLTHSFSFLANFALIFDSLEVVFEDSSGSWY